MRSNMNSPLSSQKKKEQNETYSAEKHGSIKEAIDRYFKKIQN